MTHAVLMVLIFLAILLIFHAIFLLLLLRAKSKEKSQSKQISNDKRSSNPELGLTQSKDDFLIVFASQSGQTEHYALETAQHLSKAGYSAKAIGIEHFDVVDFNKPLKILWMVSTYGEGDAPDTARQFIRNVMTKSFELNDIQYAVLAFGDRHYENFCAFGTQLNEWLSLNHAQLLFPIVRVDQSSSGDLLQWQQQLDGLLGQNIAQNLNIHQEPFHSVVLSQRKLLNEGSLGNPMYHLVFSQVEALNWQSGDILEVQCANTDLQIDDFLNQFQLTKNARNEQGNVFQQLKYKNLRSFDATQNFEQWLREAKDLPIREYSIANISSQQQLELVVRQEIHADGLGLGSGYLTEHLALGDTLNCRIRSNPAFHLIEHDAPIIFIGNGSGIAGLRSHILQRLERHFHQNWLIYGERQKAVDIGFAQEIQDWQNQGMLSDVDLTFSRDQNEQAEISPKYVQDCLLAKAEQVNTWIDRGAIIYICGSLQGMAQGVESALIDVLTQEKFEQLIEQKRYLRDVY